MKDNKSIYKYTQNLKPLSYKKIINRNIIEFHDNMHTSTKQKIRILILGGGFAGVQVLKKIQAHFKNDPSIEITLVSKDNYFLFTPMLPDVISGKVEPTHITVPIRNFCHRRTKFYEANVVSIELQNKQVVIMHRVNDNIKSVASIWQQQDSSICYHTLTYDYLILAIGNETNFFGNTNIANTAFTIKSLRDAIILRDHIINMLEQADLEQENEEQLRSLMTFVVVGGGFAGIETLGEINSLIHNCIKSFYHNVKNSRVILVNAHKTILPEVTEDLSKFALQRLREKGVEVILERRVADVNRNKIKLDDGSIISSNTLIWAGGIRPDKLITGLSMCEHDKTGRIMVNSYLEIIGNKGVFAVGDCATVIDPTTGKPCPPTAQHAIQEATVVARNIISDLERIRGCKGIKDNDKKIKFSYRTKGVMAKIGERDGVGILLGHKVHGFNAWLLWCVYYLAKLPTFEKKCRVTIDLVTNILFRKINISRLKTIAEVHTTKQVVDEIELIRNHSAQKALELR